MKTAFFLLLACPFLFSLNAFVTFYFRKDKDITTETVILYQHLKTLDKEEDQVILSPCMDLHLDLSGIISYSP